MSIAQKYLYEDIQKRRCISTGLETKPDRQSSTHAGVQVTLNTKLREEIQQLRMNHDSKHREIDNEVKAKGPRRAMEQVLELDEANVTVRWSSRPCEGRPEGSGRTQEQPALLVSIPNRRRVQDRRRTKSVCRSLRRVKEQQAGSAVLIGRSSCSIHSRRSVVTVSTMRWCEIPEDR